MTTYHAVVYDAEPDEGGYWSEVLELPGCVAQADSLDGLLEELRLAIDAWLETRDEMDGDGQEAHVQGIWQVPV